MAIKGTIDSSEIPRGSVLETDICIVGSGPAGLTIAAELVNSGRDVLLLESGGPSFERATQDLYVGESLGLDYPALHTARSRLWGGTSNCWGGWCRPLDEIDFEARDWVPHSGWPFGRAYLVPFYRRAAGLLGLDFDSFDGPPPLAAERAGWILPDHASGKMELATCQLSPRPRLATVLGPRVLAASNVRTVLHANVTQISATGGSRGVSGVVVQNLKGNRFRVEAKVVVVAGGAIENARLLLASQGQGQGGLGNGRDLVGRFFMEHPRVASGVLRLSEDVGDLRLHDAREVFDRYPAGVQLSLPADQQREERLLNAKSWIVRHYRGEFDRGGRAAEALASATFRRTMRDRILKRRRTSLAADVVRALSDPVNTVAFSVGRVTHLRSLVARRVLVTSLEVAPNPNNRVTLGRQHDAFGNPGVELEWRLGDAELETLGVMRATFDRSMRDTGMGTVENLLPSEGWPADLEWQWHHLGTTRMHHSERQGVVDADCKVHGLENLYMAGGSVFPTCGADMPTLTIVALALRLADQLRNR